MRQKLIETKNTALFIYASTTGNLLSRHVEEKVETLYWYTNCYQFIYHESSAKDTSLTFVFRNPGVAIINFYNFIIQLFVIMRKRLVLSHCICRFIIYYCKWASLIRYNRKYKLRNSSRLILPTILVSFQPCTMYFYMIWQQRRKCLRY